MKVVLNKCYGGFGVSVAVMNMLEDFGLDYDMVYDDYNTRFNKDLINIIEEYGTNFCSGYVSNLQIVEISDNITDYKIKEYDGYETIIYVVNGLLFEA